MSETVSVVNARHIEEKLANSPVPPRQKITSGIEFAKPSAKLKIMIPEEAITAVAYNR